MTAQPPAPSKLAADAQSQLGDGGSSSGSLYGASSDVLNASFDVSGLPGLTGKKNPTGQDVLQAFLAAGQSSDQATRNMVAAIEYALYESNYYGDHMPNMHEVTQKDAAALAQALTDLHNANAGGAVGGDSTGALKGMSISQFLTSQATLAAANGPQSPGQAAQGPKVIRTPNPADLAAEYEKVAQNLEGKKPTQAETQAFVRQYLSDYRDTALGQASSQYQGMVASARQRQATGQAPGTPVSYNPATDLAGNLNPNVSQGETQPPLAGNMNPMVNQGGAQPGGPTDPSITPDTSGSEMTLAQAIATGIGSGILPDPLAQNSVEFASDPQSIDSAAENFAKNANPTAVHQNDLGNTMNMFLNLITKKMV